MVVVVLNLHAFAEINRDSRLIRESWNPDMQTEHKIEHPRSTSPIQANQAYHQTRASSASTIGTDRSITILPTKDLNANCDAGDGNYKYTSTGAAKPSPTMEERIKEELYKDQALTNFINAKEDNAHQVLYITRKQKCERNTF